MRWNDPGWGVALDSWIEGDPPTYDLDRTETCATCLEHVSDCECPEGTPSLADVDYDGELDADIYSLHRRDG